MTNNCVKTDIPKTLRQNITKHSEHWTVKCKQLIVLILGFTYYKPRTFLSRQQEGWGRENNKHPFFCGFQTLMDLNKYRVILTRTKLFIFIIFYFCKLGLYFGKKGGTYTCLLLKGMILIYGLVGFCQRDYHFDN